MLTMNIKLLKRAIQMSNMPRVIIAQIAVITLFLYLQKTNKCSIINLRYLGRLNYNSCRTQKLGGAKCGR